ncbi:MAG: hypothetical protein QME61_00580, partial [Patescibacteria group bacterium]|nr:hypothetical protein [Patescibacteria group bacterium]
MTKENSNNYISLQEASKFCNYSQEYLSLRARQGKLKAVKFGRNWVTKKEWLEEYLKKVGEYNLIVQNVKRVEPPKEIEKVIEKKPIFRPIGLGLMVALVFILLIAGIVFGKENFKNVYLDLKPYLTKISQAGNLKASSLLKEIGENFDRGVELTAISAKETFQDALKTFKDFGNWIFSS